VEAAERMNLEVAFGSDRCHVLEDPWQDGALALHFEDPTGSAWTIVEYARAHPVHAIVALGDRPTPTAARACRALGLAHHPPEATDVCRDKYRSRERLRDAGMRVPAFSRFPLSADPRQIFAAGRHKVGFPCVLKPLALSGSRGVIRADDPQDAVRAFERIQELLRSPEVGVLREETSNSIQVEAYIEGDEIAVEALVEDGRLQVLAIFDKPDPLVCPFFEESIYVTPSRLSPETQSKVVETLERAVRALGLWHGPLHAEMRLTSESPWVLEVAARPIGGLCARALHFHLPSQQQDIPLEEVILRLALKMDLGGLEREPRAAGVMMIPIPEAGFYEEAQGLDEARATPGVDSIEITAKPKQKLVPLPEGASYLGFIFARAEKPEQVEQALREAHGKLRFVVSAALPVVR
jgi:formate-dependent phosphoribosylglycinamide formyltransferase (GAR transformylase)